MLVGDARGSRRPCCRQLTNSREPGLAADEDVLGDRHVRGERELLVDRDDAERAGRRAGVAKRDGLAVEARSCPASGGWAPDRIFSSVDLPAPFSPSSAWISPAPTSKSTSSSACTPGKRLLIPVMRSRGSVMRLPELDCKREARERHRSGRGAMARRGRRGICRLRLLHLAEALGLVRGCPW